MFNTSDLDKLFYDVNELDDEPIFIEARDKNIVKTVDLPVELLETNGRGLNNPIHLV